MAKRFFLFFVTIGLICSLVGLSACKSPSSPSGGNPQPVRYTVVYMNGETKVGEQPYTANSVIDWSEIVNKLTAPDGKEFAYWYTDLAKPEETKISEGYKVTSNITLYAYFEKAATPEETYTVKFVKDDGSTVVKSFTEQTAETAITVPGETPVSTKGYDVFDGWYLNGDMESPVTGTYTIKAEDAQEGVITIKAVYKQTVHVEKIVSGTDTNGATWFWIGGVKVFAFVTGGSYGEGLWVPVTNHVTAGEGVAPTNFDAKVVLYPDWENFYLVRTNSETTKPDLDMVLDGQGRVYNKTHDIINGEAGTIAETEVYDYVPEGYIRICTKDIAGKGFTYSADKKLVVYVFDSTASADQVVGWFDITRYDDFNFYFSLSDAQAEATRQGKTVTDFIFVQLNTSDATSDWANREYQSENIGYYQTNTVYYPKTWSSNGY